MNVKAQHWLVTLEWRSLGRHSSNRWQRGNEVVHGCVSIWWAKYLEECGKLYEKQKAKHAKSGFVSDRPSVIEHSFISATPISPEGFLALDGVVG